MVNAVDTSGGQIPLVQTSPDSITLHRIEDHELEVLMNITRPYSLGFGTMALGGFLGLLPSVLSILDRAAGGLSRADAVILLVAGGTLVGGLILGIFAVRALVDANKAIRRIRSRPKLPV